MGGRGSGGKNKKPTAQRRAEGNRGRRKYNEKEPKPPPDGQPVMPAGMSPAAQRFWNYLLPIVTAMQVMTVADAVALGELSMALDRRMQAEAMIQKFTILIPQKNEKGDVIGVKKNPAVAVASDAERHIRGYLADFGLMPGSRSKVAAAPPGDGPADSGSALGGILRAKGAADDVVM